MSEDFRRAVQTITAVCFIVVLVGSVMIIENKTTPGYDQPGCPGYACWTLASREQEKLNETMASILESRYKMERELEREKESCCCKCCDGDKTATLGRDEIILDGEMIAAGGIPVEVLK